MLHHVFILVFGICAAFPTWAAPIFKLTSGYKAMTEAIHSFSVDGRAIPKGGPCEKILMDASTMLGRPMTADEINESIQDILKQTGETLVSTGKVVHVSDRGPSWCFVGPTQIWTPNGLVSIFALRPGEQVLSFDLDRDLYVENTVRFITKAPGELVGRLIDQDSPIDVTPGHRFLTGDLRENLTFQPISDILPDQFIYRCSVVNQYLSPVRRGRYQMQSRPETVYELSLEGEPRNFVAEGLLVHNVKIID